MSVKLRKNLTILPAVFCVDESTQSGTHIQLDLRLLMICECILSVVPLQYRCREEYVQLARLVMAWLQGCDWHGSGQWLASKDQQFYVWISWREWHVFNSSTDAVASGLGLSVTEAGFFVCYPDEDVVNVSFV